MSRYEKLQEQIEFASGRIDIYGAKKLEKLINKAKEGKGVFCFAENYWYPLGVIFDFYTDDDKNNKRFCVVSEELKEKLIKICE